MVLTEKTCGEPGLSLEMPRRLLVGADNSRPEVFGEAEVDITRKGKSIKSRVSVVRGASRNLLGVDEIYKSDSRRQFPDNKGCKLYPVQSLS